MSKLGNGGPIPKRRRTYNVRLVRATWPYTVQEIAGLFQVHKGAVLRWLKEGLEADCSQRPFLVRGDELIRFLSARRQKRRRKCRPNEFYCFRCREPREAYGRMVDITIESTTRCRVKGLCAICEAPISKMQSMGNLAKLQVAFHVLMLAERHLMGLANTSVSSDLERRI